MESKKPSAIKTKGDVFPYDFFAALNRGDDDAAMDHLRSEAIPDSGGPSPRAEALIKSGEWDSNQKLSLVFVDTTACAGKVGNDGYRFCGKPMNFCKVTGHTKHTIGKIKRGWYIACLGRSQGVFTSPFLPAEADGGPIRSSGAGRLSDGETPFRLTKGQWRFIINSWHAANVEALSDNISIQTSESADKAFDLTSFTKRFEEELGNNLPSPTGERNNSSMEESSIEGNSGDCIRALESRLEQLLRSNVTIQEECNAKIQAMETAMATRFQQLDEERSALIRSFRMVNERLQTLERNGRSEGSESTPTEEIVEKVEALEHAVMGPHGTVANIKLQLSQFREKVESGGGVSCNGVTFNSKREFLTWFDSVQPPVEIFLDALAFLHTIRSAVVYVDEASRQRESQIKTAMDSYLQVGVITSFDTIIPSVFVGGKKMPDAGGSVYEWLNANLKTFEVWKPKGGQTHGVSQTITDGIVRVSERVIEVRNVETTDPQVIMLSTGICHDSAAFCNQLVSFMTEQHDALTAYTSFTSQQVWAMQLECLEKIIKELSEAREKVADAARMAKGYYVWGMIKAWEIQKRYIANKFKNDPALTGIMVRRILMSGTDASIKDKLAKIDMVVNKLDVLSNKVDEHHRSKTAEMKKLKDLIDSIKKQ